MTHPSSSRLARWIGTINPYDPASLERDGLRPIEVEASAFKRRTARLVIVFFLVFAAWALFAPLDGGVTVPGTVVVQGNRKAVQHPSGGVVEKIHVKEGSVVKQGDALLVLNALNVDAALSTAELEHISTLTTLARALSERAHRAGVEWGSKLKRYQGDARLAEAMRLQTEVFRSRTAELAGQQKILGEQITGLLAQQKGLVSALKEREHQLGLLAEQARDTAALAKDGFVPRNQAYDVERTRSDLLATIARTQSDLAQTQAAIAATRLQLSQLLSTYHKDLDAQISDLQKTEQALVSKVDALRFERGLVEIRAPASGTVVGLRAHTVGGVVPPGQVLMEIVPDGARLVVDAQVPSLHIDRVQAGAETDLRFTSFNRATTPVIPGKVLVVGADKLAGTSQSPTEAAAGSQNSDYYLVQIEVTPEGVKKLAELKVQPGMNVEVIIKTGERSLVSYLLKPVTDRLARAFVVD